MRGTRPTLVVAGHEKAPPASLPVRIYTTPNLHRALPYGVELLLLRLLVAAWWRKSRRYREAHLAAMRDLLDRSPRRDEVAALARRYAYVSLIRDVRMWRPWRVGKVPVEGAEVLSQMARERQGAILSFMHHGPFGELPGALDRHGIRLHVPVASQMVRDLRPGYPGRRDRRHVLNVRHRRAIVFDAAGSFDYMTRLIQEGATIMLANDLPGRLPMNFLGRRVGAASGLARLAHATAAPIFPVSSVPYRTFGRFVVQPPIDPTEFATLEALQAEIARRHEPAILAWPEALEWPWLRWTVLDD